MNKTQFLSIEINNETIHEIVMEKIQEKIAEIDNEKLFYTLDDLQAITGFSKGHIMNTFFHDTRFTKIRRKIGRKWLFPVKETRTFLLEWIQEQPNE